MPKSHECQNCGKQFSVAYWRANPPSFCGLVCSNTSRSRPLEDRFWEKVQKLDDCWLWTGATMKGGYGILRGGKEESAHRLSYVMHNGPIPDGMFVCHTCNKPECVRPDHLILMSEAESHEARVVPLIERFWLKVNKTDMCWLWTGANTGRKWPYGVIGAGTKDDGLLKAHHVSWEMHNGKPVPDGMWVLHKCDVTLCVNPEHLFLGDAAANMADMVIKNRCETEKLTQEEVDDIRRRYAAGTVTQQSLAEEFGVSGGAIWFAVHHKTWKHRRNQE